MNVFKFARNSVVITLFAASNASALQLDWSGQFRSEFNYIGNYVMDNSGTPIDAVRQAAGGYYVTPAGATNAQFETLFMRVRPNIIVNDNVSLKSEWWLGNPVFGFFGSAQPQQAQERFFNSTQSRGSTISAQRFWGEFLTDFGTVQVGRVPLNYGLGIVWNSGDGLWDHYESTGDAIRLISKFSAFTFSPSVISYTIGNAVGGSCQFSSITGLCTPMQGSAGVTDYSILLQYDNSDEDLTGGLNFVRRIIGGAQDPTSGYSNPFGNKVGEVYNTWDIYAKKRFGKLSLAAEIPLTSGSVGNADFNTYAVAAEANYKASDTWEFKLRGGLAPGQGNEQSGNTTSSSFKAFYMNPNYHLGLIMFNYQLRNFGQLSTLNNAGATNANLASPFYNPIVNAGYGAVEGLLHTDKWTFDAGFVYASALQHATNGSDFYNYWDQRYAQTAGVGTPAVKDQQSGLGWEIDLGASFQYDEYFNFRLDTGLFAPGGFYAFSNTATDNPTDLVFAIVARVGVSF